MKLGKIMLHEGVLKMYRFLLVTICLLLFLVSCNASYQGESHYIDVEKAMASMQPIYVSDLAEKVKYIPLETTDSSLINKRPYIRKFRNTLLVASMSQPIMMFDIETGKYIKNVGGIGQGRGEYVPDYERPVFWTDSNENHIFVKSAGGRILQYDSTGNYMGFVRLPKEIRALSGLSQIATDNYFYFYRNHLFEERAYDILKVDYHAGTLEDSITGKQQAMEEESVGNLMVFPGFGGIPVSPTCYIFRLRNSDMALDYKEDPCLWNYMGDVYFKKRFNDTIYQVNGHSMHPRYVFQLGGRCIPNEERFKTEGVDDKISIEYVLESKKALLFMLKTKHYHIEPNIYWGIYNKHTHEVKICNGGLDDENNGCVVEELHTATSDGTIVGLISAERYMEMLGNTQKTEEDNPVAVILE